MVIDPRLRVADLARLGGLGSFVWAFLDGQGVNAALFALVMLGLVLPRFLGASPRLDLLNAAVLLFAAWCAVLDLYLAHPWLDLVVHAVACGLVTVFAWRLLVALSVLPRTRDRSLRRAGLGIVLTATALGSMLGLVWELGEWFGHSYLDDRIQVGYDDTLGDLVADGIGALVVGLVLAARARPSPRSGPGAAGPPPGAGLDVSVVIPVKDDAGPLAECLALLRAQTLPAFEVVVVDNGSVDDSAAVAAGFGARVVSEPRPGIPAAAATGYDAARGEVIARCDADSRPPAHWLEQIAGRMAEEPDLEALTGSGRFYDLSRWVEPVARWAYLGSYYVLVHAAMGKTTLWGSNMALRTETWRDVRHLVHLDPELHDDMDLAFCLGPERRVRYDGRLVVGVSARSLRGGHQLRRRMDRAVRTLRANWDVTPPWTRWRARLEPSRNRP